MNTLKSIFLLSMMFFSSISLLYAYEVAIEDNYVYEFVNGEYIQAGANYKVTYEVDETQGIVYEKRPSNQAKNQNIPNIVEVPNYKIISKDNGVLIAMRNWDKGSEILTFYKNGIYYFLQSIETKDEETGDTKLNTTFSFGRFNVDLKYLP